MCLKLPESEENSARIDVGAKWYAFFNVALIAMLALHQTRTIILIITSTGSQHASHYKVSP